MEVTEPTDTGYVAVNHRGPDVKNEVLIIGIHKILEVAGFDVSSRWRLVRHQDDRYPVDELRRQGWFDLYPCYQGRPIFHNVEHVVSFYGLPGSRAGFYGIYKILGHIPAHDGVTVASCPWSFGWHQDARFFYRMERDSSFDCLRDRLIIDWGRGTRSWVQMPVDKQVLEIREPGRQLPLFEDYLEFTLTFDELRDLFSNEEAHRDWKSRLSAVGGIYLILAVDSGELYVGSASGEGGFWERWRQYARSGHGRNKLLQDIISRNPLYPSNFRYSVLQILPKTMTREEILRREAIYKMKLGSRAKGLNMN